MTAYNLIKEMERQCVFVTSAANHTDMEIDFTFIF